MRNKPGRVAPGAMRNLVRALECLEDRVPMEDGSCLVVEIRGGPLSRVRLDGHVDVVAMLQGGPNGAARHRGYCYVCACDNGGLCWEADSTGLTRAVKSAGWRPSGCLQGVYLAVRSTSCTANAPAVRCRVRTTIVTHDQGASGSPAMPPASTHRSSRALFTTRSSTDPRSRR